MMMFGVIHFQGDGTGANDYIKAGWNNVAPPVAQQIITFPILPVLLPVHLLGHNPIDGTNVPDPDIPGNITRTALFERKFRKIASTSVGRMLLYRILIEIRRHTAAGNNAGRLEGIITPPVIGMILRNSNRCISIYSGVKSSYNSNRQKIRIREINKRHTIIGKTTAHNDDGHTAIGTSESSIDISLFHEMTHWYHTLRDPKRKNKEVADFDDDDLNLRNYHLGAYYWSGLDNCITKWGADRMIISQNGWGNFEEMRTILGVPYGGSVHQYTGGDNIYKEGDDLSENLYRVCIGSPIRFGHSRNDFYEDRKVINKVINAVNESHMFYIKGYIAPVSPFNNPNRRNGLGDCRK
jgi:hypothetical protein